MCEEMKENKCKLEISIYCNANRKDNSDCALFAESEIDKCCKYRVFGYCTSLVAEAQALNRVLKKIIGE